jgi:hypothetical protein
VRAKQARELKVSVAAGGLAPEWPAAVMLELAELMFRVCATDMQLSCAGQVPPQPTLGADF